MSPGVKKLTQESPRLRPRDHSAHRMPSARHPHRSQREWEEGLQQSPSSQGQKSPAELLPLLLSPLWEPAVTVTITTTGCCSRRGGATSSS